MSLPVAWSQLPIWNTRWVQVIYMEWGRFWSSHLPRTYIDEQLDNESVNPGDRVTILSSFGSLPFFPSVPLWLTYMNMQPINDMSTLYEQNSSLLPQELPCLGLKWRLNTCSYNLWIVSPGIWEDDRGHVLRWDSSSRSGEDGTGSKFIRRLRTNKIKTTFHFVVRPFPPRLQTGFDITFF